MFVVLDLFYSITFIIKLIGVLVIVLKQLEILITLKIKKLYFSTGSLVLLVRNLLEAILKISEFNRILVRILVVLNPKLKI